MKKCRKDIEKIHKMYKKNGRDGKDETKAHISMIKKGVIKPIRLQSFTLLHGSKPTYDDLRTFDEECCRPTHWMTCWNFLGCL